MQKVSQRVVARFGVSSLFIHLCSMNITTTFFFATECSDVSICLSECACHNTFVLYLALIRVGLSVLLWM